MPTIFCIVLITCFIDRGFPEPRLITSPIASLFSRVSNIPLVSGKGGNSETMLDIVVAEGVKGGAHKDWFTQLNVGGKGGIPKETLLAISHDFFDEHHEGLLNTKGAWNKRRTVSDKYKTTKVNQTTFVSFTENHPLFEPYKKSTGS